MQDKIAKILIVDDDPMLLNLHELYIEKANMIPVTALNGDQALQYIANSSHDIDLIVSDVAMPMVDGYELCTQIKANDATKDIPVIFVSALSTLEEKMKGYAAGGEAYATKPIEYEELIAIINNLLSVKHNKNTLKNQLAESNQVAMQAMTYSSDLGRMLEFLQGCIRAKNYDGLATSLNDVMTGFDLHYSLAIYTPDDILVFSDKTNVSPLESDIIELARKKARFFDIGARTFINYDKFSLLIKNMPIEDQNKHGILKDSLGTLCNAIEEKVNALITNDQHKRKEDILTTVKTALDQVSNAVESIQKNNLNAINTMIEDLDDTIMSLGLLEYQENNIREIAITCLDTTRHIFHKSTIVNEKFDEIRERLTSILSDQ